jgi:hypothetical protein
VVLPGPRVGAAPLAARARLLSAGWLPHDRWTAARKPCRGGRLCRPRRGGAQPLRRAAAPGRLGAVRRSRVRATRSCWRSHAGCAHFAAVTLRVGFGRTRLRRLAGALGRIRRPGAVACGPGRCRPVGSPPPPRPGTVLRYLSCWGWRAFDVPSAVKSVLRTIGEAALVRVRGESSARCCRANDGDALGATYFLGGVVPEPRTASSPASPDSGRKPRLRVSKASGDASWASPPS